MIATLLFSVVSANLSVQNIVFSEKLKQNTYESSRIAASSIMFDTIQPVSSLMTNQKFTYQLITQEYITNENGYFLDVKIDTCYLIFMRAEGQNTYTMGYFGDEKGKSTWKKAQSLQQMSYTIRFNSKGSVAELVNWTEFRDVLASSLSKQAQAKLITGEQFDVERVKINNEKLIRRLVMEDVLYLFELCDDSIREDGEYIRIKPVRSPFSGEDMYLQGNLITERPQGTKNTIKFHTQNQAGPNEKPILLQECMEFMASNTDGSQPTDEIQRVGVNNEIDYQYNLVQKVMYRVILSDVLAINFQSRGNIRTFTFWGKE